MKSFLIVLCTFVSVACFAQTTIKPEEAKDNIGKEVTVCGKVFNTHVSKNGTNFLNFGAAYPNEVFSVVVFSKDVQAFSSSPSDLYKDKNICVTGKVELYQSKPEMIVEVPSQIK